MADFENGVLGRTGIPVGPLGISSSFGAEAAAYEEAFERGCNYFTWGTFMKGRSAGMREAIRNITRSGKRDQLVVGMLTYAHNAALSVRFRVSPGSPNLSKRNSRLSGALYTYFHSLDTHI